jgi:hypothetical protein
MPAESNGTDVVVSPVADSFEAYEAMRRGETPKVEDAKPAATEQEAKTEEDSDPSATEQDESRERDDKGQFKPKKSDVPEGVQKRIDKAVAKQREAERRAEELERRLAEKETQPAKAAEVTTEAKDKPTPDKFSTYEEYVEALTDWKTDQKLAIARKAEAAEAQKRAEGEQKQSRAKEWVASEAEAREAHADYDDAIQEAAEAIKEGKLPAISDQTFAAIMETDSKAAILYHLAKNRADLERLASAPASRVMFELGKIEAKLAAPVQETEKKVAKAPKPPTPVNNRSASSISRETAKTFEEYEAARNAKLYRK